MPDAPTLAQSLPHQAEGAPAAASPAAAAAFRAKVRLYRHGLGDCLLVTLARRDGSSYFILIDCGVILGTPDAAAIMARVVADVAATTGGKLDLLVATHEHWDHLSGFVQAAEAFKQLRVEQVWLGWTENPTDPLGTKLAKEREQALAGLRLAVSRLNLAGDEASASAVASVLDFFGATHGPTTRDALEFVRNLTTRPRYCDPADPPVELDDPKARLYVLGPPRDERLLKTADPSKAQPQTYGAALAAFEQGAPLVTERRAPEPPFSTRYAIPTAVARTMDCFQRYWGGDVWRRIDASWLGPSADLALQLDNATNNTSLVLAIELDGGDVLLFAADAQVGNWLSWQQLKWTVGEHEVTGPDLLRRTILYKVGHHGSHNATLSTQGLETMDRLRLAMIPVDQAVAQKRGWGRMPFQALLDALGRKTNGALLRSDANAPAQLAGAVVANDLFFEVTL